jgi:transcriptional regulator with XRE-family HTH domain
MSELRSAFGQKIRAIRKSQKISQEGLANRCGLHYTYIGAVERGECNLSFDNIHKIAKALGVPIGDLFALPEAQESLSPENALRKDLLDSMLSHPNEDLRLSVQVLTDTTSWLGKKNTKPRRKRRKKTATESSE